MARLQNSYRGVCKCGTIVQPQQGYVHERRITCIQCVPMPPQPTYSTGGQNLALSGSQAVSYQGCDDHESWGEYMYDTFHDESDFLGWDVGAQ